MDFSDEVSFFDHESALSYCSDSNADWIRDRTTCVSNSRLSLANSNQMGYASTKLYDFESFYSNVRIYQSYQPKNNNKNRNLKGNKNYFEKWVELW